MGLRFRKSIKIASGVKINLNKKSVGVTIGAKGIHYSANTSGRKTSTVGLLGTGLSYTSVSNAKKKPTSSVPIKSKKNQQTQKDYHFEKNFIFINKYKYTYTKLHSYKNWFFILGIALFPLGIVTLPLGIITLFGSLLLLLLSNYYKNILKEYNRYKRENI